jgi:acyl-CoA synthetase (AMP-forming)/AMP-acid ligase II
VTAARGSFRRDIAAMIEASPTRIALIDAVAEGSCSYAELGALMARTVALLRDGGGSFTGRCVLSLLPNSVEQLVAFLGSVYEGAHFLPVAADATPREVARWVRLVRPSLVLAPWDLGRDLRAVFTDNRIPVVAVTLGGGFDWLPAAAERLDASGQPAGRLYLTTSGSTGEPRAVVYDGDVLWASAVAFAGVHPFLDRNARFLNFLPMSYLGGLFNLGLIPLACGGSVVVTESLSGRTLTSFWHRVEQHEISVLWLIPSLLKGLVESAQQTKRQDIAGRVSAVTACFVGMSPTDLASKTRFEREFGIPVLENYGLCETTFLTSERLTGRQRRVEGSVGEPIPGVTLDVRLLAAQTDDGPASAGAEILAKTPYLFLGYLREDGSLDRPVTADGFFATRDLGRLEDSGTLVLEGRTGEIIKKGDALVSLRALELLAERHELVAEAAALASPHEFYGQTALLFVRFHGAGRDERAALQAFRPWLHENLVRAQWPDGIVAVADFPRTRNGKIAKAQLRAEHQRHAAAEALELHR